MKTTDIIRRAGMNLRQAKARTILTSLAIGVGAFTIALALAAGNGGRNYTEQMVNTSGDMHSLSVYPKFEQEQTSDELPEYGAVPTDDAATASKGTMNAKDTALLKSIDGVESVRPLLSVESSYMTRGEGYKKRVATLSVKDDRTEMKLAAGSLKDNMLGVGEVVIPEGFLSSFGFENAESAIGKTLFINVAQQAADGMPSGQSRDFSYRIVAVDRPSDTVLFYQEAVRVSPEDSQTMYEYQRGKDAGEQYFSATVLVKPGADVAAVQQAIKNKGYEVYSLQDVREQLLTMIGVVQWGLAGFGGLAVLASVFGIINTQYISVLERTQQIGLMKALGMRRGDVSRLFRYEAAWIGFLGGMIGVVLAFLVTLFNPLIASTLKLEKGIDLLQMDWVMSAALVAGLMLVAILSGYFPSRKAAKLDPIEALRTE